MKGNDEPTAAQLFQEYLGVPRVTYYRTLSLTHSLDLHVLRGTINERYCDGEYRYSLPQQHAATEGTNNGS